MISWRTSLCNIQLIKCWEGMCAGPHSAVGSASDSRARSRRLDTRSGHMHFSFHWFKNGSCQLLAKVCAQSTG